MQAYIDEQHYISRRSFREEIHHHWNHRCAYCGTELGSQPTLDHVHPKSEGGLYVWQNLISACLRCNREKGAQHWLAWFRDQPWHDPEREAAISCWTASYVPASDELDQP